MGTVTGGQGNIVTNGLVLRLDAANPRSYAPPYNGTAWTDIAAGNVATLINGTNFSTSGSGCMVFDGTNDYGTIPSSINWALSSSSTVNVWCNPTSGNGYIMCFQKGSWLGWYITAGGTFLYCGQVGADQTTGFGSISYGNWYQLTAVVDRENLLFKTYKNGIYITQTTITQPGIGTAAALILGARSSPDFFYNGKTSNIQIYNRVLSDSEILQNFNATRARFGI